MAAPRVFVSSTFYDLHQVRNDIEAFLNSIGYDPVMNERGTIPYTQTTSLEQDCYDEVAHSDILICIIGGKYGTSSSDPTKSITMKELDTAIKERKLVYIYIDRNVYAENQTFEHNKGKIEPFHADNIKVHEYISELRHKNYVKPIETFESARDIVDNLRKQLAGKFQRLLQEESHKSSQELALELNECAQSLRETVDSASSSWNDMFNTLSSLSLSPLGPIQYIKRLLSILDYEILVRKKSNLISFLEDIGFLDSDPLEIKDSVIMQRRKRDTSQKLSISKDIFEEDGSIKNIRSIAELKELITLKVEDNDDGLPF